MAEIAALLGDPARMSMLCSLAEGRELSARELASRAGVTPQTASGHIAKLVLARLVSSERRGRERMHSFGHPDVMRLLSVVHEFSLHSRPGLATEGEPDSGLQTRVARTCYDHMGGRLATSLAERLLPSVGGEMMLSADGENALRKWGLAGGLESGIDPRCCLCDDWSESKPHIAGDLGAAILKRSLELRWLRPLPASRALILTHAGRDGYRRMFGLALS